MTFTDALTQIPLMFYVCLVLMPLALVFYFLAERPRVIKLASADPAALLQDQRVNAKKLIIKNCLLGAVLGVGISLIVFLIMLGADWYDSTGIFAVQLSYNAFPPAQVDAPPPTPPSFSGDAAAGGSDSSPANLK